MPELPEVETVRRGLWPRLEGYEFNRVDLYRSGLRYEFTDDFIHLIENRTLISLERRGKYLAFGLNDGAHIISHLGMSGSFRLESQPLVSTYHGANHKEKHHHVRFWLKNKTSTIWLDYHDPRRFGFMLYRAKGTLESLPPWCNLGVEPLSEDFANVAIFKKITSLNISIKSALIRQDLIAGLGNIYVLEALYLSRISPFTKASLLKKSEFAALMHNIKSLLHASIEKGGSSLKDHRSIDGTLGHFQDGFFVYGRENQACLGPNCRGRIKRVIDHGRSSFFCPLCQKIRSIGISAKT
jgi:formamidopyrimidine-DNA glycosylase